MKKSSLNLLITYSIGHGFTGKRELKSGCTQKALLRNLCGTLPLKRSWDRLPLSSLVKNEYNQLLFLVARSTSTGDIKVSPW
jgi:hypothetical protein